MFKVRQLEKQGRLHPIHGAMGSAWYDPGEVAALRRAPGGSGPSLARTGGEARWSDAALIAHLRGLPEGPDGPPRPRTIVDLVADTGIPISRAERVYRFWLAHDAHPTAAAARTGGAPSPIAPPAAAPKRQAPTAPASPAAERRSGERLERDALLRQMRDPDPRVRSAAFDRLKKRR